MVLFKALTMILPVSDTNLATFITDFCNQTYPILGRQVYEFDDNIKRHDIPRIQRY